MNWAVWAPSLGITTTAIVALITNLYREKKNHKASLKQIDSLRIQADAATTSANASATQAAAALEAARAGTKTAETTAKAAIDDTFTKAYEAASKNWAESNKAQQQWNDIQAEAQQRWNEAQAIELRRVSERQAQTDMALEAEKLRANRFEHLYALAIIYLHSVYGWIAEHVPGETPPPPPPEIGLDLYPKAS